MALHPFDIPHILENVSQYLSSHELVQCVLVCKDWSQYFTSFLWQEVDAWQISTEVQLTALHRHQVHVHTLNGFPHVKGISAETFHQSWPFPNLRKVVYRPRKASHFRPSMTLVLQCLSHLESVETLELGELFKINNSSGSKKDTKKSVFAAISDSKNILKERAEVCNELFNLLTKSLPKLKNFSLLRTEFYPEFIPRILEACWDCPNVSFEFIRTRLDMTPFQAEATMRVIEDMPPANIERLHLSCGKMTGFFGMFPFLEILRACPDLEELKITGKTQSYDLRSLRELFKEKHFARLKHLHLDTYDWVDSHEPFLIDLFKFSGQCSSCRSSSSNNDHILSRDNDENYDSCGETKDCENCGGGLESLTALTRVASTRALVEYHSATLTKLKLEDCSIEVLSIVLNGLPNLKALEAYVYLGKDAEEQVDELIVDSVESSPSWAWCGLKTLTLQISSSGIKFPKHLPSNIDSWTELLEAESRLKLLFSILGKLEQVEKLFLRPDQDEDKSVDLAEIFLLRRGLLQRLKSLKQLEELRFGDASSLDLGECEARWFAENWPSLKAITQDYFDEAGIAFKEKMAILRPRVIVSSWFDSKAKGNTKVKRERKKAPAM
ncbi:hypothetical protein BX616_007951 [Lobosporangium transversale]|uniref:F-box domain-containing protein n=1 Tax=Lobosporangium transversale TaxID=64571 RepID=A0A1Y2H006_9FUNG|nr:hypothetical protein BCR41DRAFT_346663 [Lobosporangium transversale]KAF9914597.1 hypothetical protein BX616_007951 [Lobosporangium transversale]ORZ27331.1 hypothetical protein BCR41DRAFT_346663 [Lobosporangium transversale]|eukprot:XP_021885058.1 hypothetical protein BCR41DRAFT_346663 [Lobosporangium transversale]